MVRPLALSSSDSRDQYSTLELSQDEPLRIDYRAAPPQMTTRQRWRVWLNVPTAWFWLPLLVLICAIAWIAFFV
jgi:hypothetical protein